ncbi:MAG: 3-hydroxyacyl-ACP dehydratase FabZ [Sphaerochaeta sp.]|jgi:3-hydroxyacyl-[acyl-carrier-protein] dehydratase|uniref:3-hydroxyacyl-ACP dehydratase FabZ n=1 Tax=unclassified Sphaerochaeta TaxID=2637943 RepID=UPI000ED75C9F|nr:MULTISPECIES: 3-hydroxyacyl-ACP dehydratase FabZ [unclassified Sphaerochaeta]MCK9598937.1 3-hydroxyacyl-ACP dehydratase FabZ [Sphaerochaeta sp.]MDX9824725.1 3-hydroxyacyl-ACP dehydratase FabZ [Sphaerochaeta sp.]MEA4866149.1 3-hydroxyacyl-ACP dehydratase FabZ [Sphaerochaeta sp.]HAP56566.1 beta-hydroxyacyl-ACP dehydratase [Sphaerochaeta sp.]HCU30382.1 beta-hydroxyacyl-ACP dehydratase [Sphaerochaeta sp.]
MSGPFESPVDLIPHRDPFIFLDELLEVDEKHTVAKRVFTPDHFFFKGHFPGYPVVPGVILVETMAQCGGAGLVQAGLLPHGAFFVLATIDKAKFRNQVKPDDTAIIEVHNARVSQAMVRQSGTITVDGKVAAEAAWMCIVGDNKA